MVHCTTLPLLHKVEYKRSTAPAPAHVVMGLCLKHKNHPSQAGKNIGPTWDQHGTKIVIWFLSLYSSSSSFSQLLPSSSLPHTFGLCGGEAPGRPWWRLVSSSLCSYEWMITLQPANMDVSCLTVHDYRKYLHFISLCHVVKITYYCVVTVL